VLKILCVSDQIDPQVYSPQIKERFADVDLVLAAGDLPLDYLDFIISTLNKPLFFIFGNHHTEELRHYKRLWNDPMLQEDKNYMGCGAIYLASKLKIEGKLILAGFGGSMRYNTGPNQYTEFEMYLEIIKLIPSLLWNRLKHGRFIDILLTHSPPRGIHDKTDKCHTGFKAYLWFMKTFKPKFLVHGHIHLYDLCDIRSTQWEKTTVINAFGHYLINTEDQNGN